MQITIRPTLKQHQVYEALKDPNINEVFFGGGAGGGKSWLICESRLINCYLYPGYKSFIGRTELTRLMQSTYLTFLKVCAKHKIPSTEWKLNGQYHYIEFANGSRIDLLDLALKPSDPLYERFGSLEFSDGAIEEAGEVPFMAYDVLKSRIDRHENRELGIKANLLITGNPKKNWTYREFYKPWSNGFLEKDKVFIQSLYGDNPYTADSYGKQLARIKDKVTKQRLMFGNWEYDADPTTLMNYDAIIDMFTNTAKQSSDKFLIADIARFGKDKTTISLWVGLKTYKILTYAKQGIDQTIEVIKQLARDEEIPYSNILIDEDGIGGGVIDGLRGVKGFIANTPQIKDIDENKLTDFKSLKAQCAYKLADYVNNHKIEVRTEDEDVRDLLIEELEQIKSKDPDKDSKLNIISKEEVKEAIGRSPDYSDLFLMRMFFELKPAGYGAVLTRNNRGYVKHGVTVVDGFVNEEDMLFEPEILDYRYL